MPTFTEQGTYAQAALASYGIDLSPGSKDNVDRYRATVVGMSATQAEAFDATFAVLQQSAPSNDGFSAVLLQNRRTGEKALGIAGTDPRSLGDLITDFVDIGVLGTVGNMAQYRSLEALQ